MKRAIEDSFPIVEINRLAAPERSAFKPIYQMHKWFARRASCVFRAILLGALKPLPNDENGRPTKSGAQVIMDEFYKDHTADPDTSGKIILDPFMGGGTTVVEALRLGCKVIGIDLNPVAWFIVKTEVEPVDIDELKGAFDRLANRHVEWSGKSVRDTLLEQYKTECPCCGNHDADIIYTFWVKSAICHNKLCPARSSKQGAEVPLFSDYILAYKKPSIRYWPDVTCTKCSKTFDWEIEPAALIAAIKSMQEDARTSAGEGRGNIRWAYGPGKSVHCPWCNDEVKPLPKSLRTRTGPRPERKKVSLTVLLCPYCESVWQWRGDLPENVCCPSCKKVYNPRAGNMPQSGKFVCSSCGTAQAILDSIRQLPADQLLGMRPYGIEGYCAHCHAGDKDEEKSLFVQEGNVRHERGIAHVHQCTLAKNGGKFFSRVGPKDLARYQRARETWEAEKGKLPYPKQKIPDGQETHRLLEHHYCYWHQMFNPRQLLCLSTLLKAIAEEPNQTLKELLLSAFFCTLNNVSDFCSYRTSVRALRQVFARHDFAPKNQPCENNVWGTDVGMGSFQTWVQAVIVGKTFAQSPWDYGDENRLSRDPLAGQASLKQADSATTPLSEHVDLAVTDPPYASNVNYSELSDFFYVWLRLLLAKQYKEFAPEHTPKLEEIIENDARGKTAKDFEEGLRNVFANCWRLLKPGGLLAFTFHHAEGRTWEGLLHAVCEAGFEIDSVYPVCGEAENSMHLMDKEGAIAYDLVHVCKKRDSSEAADQRSWAGVRTEIRQRAREEIRAIESGRYGNEPLSPADVNIVLIGKCLEQYSRHYGKVVDHEGNPMPLHLALEEIRMLVDQLTNEEQELPSALEDVDPPSYVYLTSLCGRSEVKSDEVHKATRGILEPDELLGAGLIIKGRAKRGRTYEVKSAIDRLPVLRKKFGAGDAKPQAELFEQDLSAVIRPGVLFIDYIQFLLGLAETGESIIDWLEEFRGRRVEIRAALEYMTRKNKSFAQPAQRIIGLMDERTLFTKKD